MAYATTAIKIYFHARTIWFCLVLFSHPATGCRGIGYDIVARLTKFKRSGREEWDSLFKQYEFRPVARQ